VPTSETNFILGARGRLGTALAASAEIGRTVAVDRSIYSSWAREGSADEVANYFAKLAGQAAGARVLVASGITDPMRPREEHHSVNYVLPRNVIEGAHRCGMKVVTFGSIMELTARDQSENAYLSSKVELGDFVSAFSAGNEGVVHIRIHTLYGGGPPSSFMFLGQILGAIARNARFDMSAGSQLREYHHVADETRAIARLLQSDIEGVIDLNHGEPFRLRDLATYIFTAFGCLDKLNVGTRPMSDRENLDLVFPKSQFLDGIEFRNTFTAVVEYLRAHIH